MTPVAAEPGRFEITHVPGLLRDRDRTIGRGAPLLARYARATFDRDRVRAVGHAPAELLAPGHPLVDAIIDVLRERGTGTLHQGTVLVDAGDPGVEPRLLIGVSSDIVDGHAQARTISRRVEFVEIRPDGSAHAAGPAPYLDYAAVSAWTTPDDLELVAAIEHARTDTWGGDLSPTAAAEARAVDHLGREHLRDITARVSTDTARIRAQVRQ